MRRTSRWDYQKKTILFLVMGMVIMLVISATAWAADTKVYKGRLSYHWAPKHYSAIMATKFAEECKKATNGRLDIEVFPSGQLYSIAQIVPALSEGSVDMGGCAGCSFYAGR